MSEKKIFIAHPNSPEQETALHDFMKLHKINYEISSEELYNPEFVKMIEKSKKQHKEGNFITLEQEDIKSFLGIK